MICASALPPWPSGILSTNQAAQGPPFFPLPPCTALVVTRTLVPRLAQCCYRTPPFCRIVLLFLDFGIFEKPAFGHPLRHIPRSQFCVGKGRSEERRVGKECRY